MANFEPRKLTKHHLASAVSQTSLDRFDVRKPLPSILNLGLKYSFGVCHLYLQPDKHDSAVFRGIDSALRSF